MVFNETWPNATFPDNSTAPPNATWFVIPPNPGRSLQADVVACTVITFLIASTFVVLRFYTRGWINHVLGASDWCILPALLCSAGVAASSLEQMMHGAGKHFWEVDPFKLPAFERAAWYGILFYNLSLTLSRISILLLYKRIFTYSWIKRTIQIVLVVVVAIGIWFIVSVCTACMPLQAFWDWSLFFTTHVYCQPPNLWWANAALHIASDLVVMALPMPVLSSLSLPRRQKYALVGVFALGFFACIISIVRLIALIDVAGKEAYDATYTSAYMIYWTTVEVNAAISCACIMTLKPFIQRVFPRLLSPSKNAREPTLQWITPHNHNNNNTDNSTHTIPHRSSLPSLPNSPISPTHSAPGGYSYNSYTNGRRPSATSIHTARNRRNSNTVSLAHLHELELEDTIEKSRYYHSFTTSNNSTGSDGGGGGGGTYYDLDHDLDLEAQRTCGSLSTTPTPAPTTQTPTPAGVRVGSGRRNSGVSSRNGVMAGEEEELDPTATATVALRAPPRAHLRLSVCGAETWPREKSTTTSPNVSPGTKIGSGCCCGEKKEKSEEEASEEVEVGIREVGGRVNEDTGEGKGGGGQVRGEKEG